jgi:hypothetical protein
MGALLCRYCQIGTASGAVLGASLLATALLGLGPLVIEVIVAVAICEPREVPAAP